MVAGLRLEAGDGVSRLSEASGNRLLVDLTVFIIAVDIVGDTLVDGRSPVHDGGVRTGSDGNVSRGRAGYQSGEADGTAPFAHAVLCAAVGTHLHELGAVGGKTGEYEGIRGGFYKVLFIAVDHDLPCGGFALLGPAQLDAVVLHIVVGEGVGSHTGGLLYDNDAVDESGTVTDAPDSHAAAFGGTGEEECRGLHVIVVGIVVGHDDAVNGHERCGVAVGIDITNIEDTCVVVDVVVGSGEAKGKVTDVGLHDGQDCVHAVAGIGVDASGTVDTIAAGLANVSKAPAVDAVTTKVLNIRKLADGSAAGSGADAYCGGRVVVGAVESHMECVGGVGFKAGHSAAGLADLGGGEHIAILVGDNDSALTLVGVLPVQHDAAAGGHVLDNLKAVQSQARGDGGEVCNFAPALLVAGGLHLELVGCGAIQAAESDIGVLSGDSGPRLLGGFSVGLDNGDVVDVQDEHVGAVEVADGHITGLTGIVAQVNGQLNPYALVFGTGICTLGAHRPFLDGGECGGIGIARGGHGNAKVLFGIAGILCLGPEADAAAEVHHRGDKVVVGSQGYTSCIGVGSGDYQVGAGMSICDGTTINEIDTAAGRTKHPVIAVAVGVYSGPVSHAVLEALADAFT